MEGNSERIRRGALAMEHGAQRDTFQAEAIDTIANVLHYLGFVRPEYDARDIVQSALEHYLHEVGK